MTMRSFENPTGADSKAKSFKMGVAASATRLPRRINSDAH